MSEDLAGRKLLQESLVEQSLQLYGKKLEEISRLSLLA